MKTNTWMYSYAKEIKEDLNKYMDMKVWERLIRKEIICCFLKKDGITSF
jgi:hypothetical protein